MQPYLLRAQHHDLNPPTALGACDIASPQGHTPIGGYVYSRPMLEQTCQGEGPAGSLDIMGGMTLVPMSSVRAARSSEHAHCNLNNRPLGVAPVELQILGP